MSINRKNNIKNIYGVYVEVDGIFKIIGEFANMNSFEVEHAEFRLKTFTRVTTPPYWTYRGRPRHVAPMI